MNLLLHLGVDEDMIKLGTEALAETTWRQYTWAFGTVAPWYDKRYQQLPKDFDDWGRRVQRVLLDLRNAGKAAGSLIICNNALSFISRLAFQKRLSERQSSVLMVRSFKRRMKTRPKQEKFWNPEIVLDYYAKGPSNETLDHRELTIKAILLVCIFTVCRPGELASVDMKTSKWSEETVHLSIQLKTSVSRSWLVVRKLESRNIKICPYTVIQMLWADAKRRDSSARTFLTKEDGQPLNARQVYSRITEGFLRTRVPKTFRPYSIKHATISYLMNKGARKEDIAQFARLSTSTDTVFKYYFRSDKREEITTMMTRGIMGEIYSTSRECESEDYLEL